MERALIGEDTERSRRPSVSGPLRLGKSPIPPSRPGMIMDALRRRGGPGISANFDWLLLTSLGAVRIHAQAVKVLLMIVEQRLVSCGRMSTSERLSQSGRVPCVSGTHLGGLPASIAGEKEQTEQSGRCLSSRDKRRSWTRPRDQ